MPPHVGDWGLWRSFAAVVEGGSLSAAARRLRLSQPTLSRHIRALEDATGGPLFTRGHNILTPTPHALALYEPVARAAKALDEAAMRAEGAVPGLSGTVRLTASTVVSHYMLPQMLVDIRIQHPEIEIELVPSDVVENLLRREADIAIRMVRPRQPDLTARHIGDLPIVACAHRSYLERRGTPGSVAELGDHDLIGMDRSTLMLDSAHQFGLALERDSFALRTDSQTLLWELTRAGLGIGFAQISLVQQSPGIVSILPQLTLPTLPVWLTTHSELFTSRRIRAIYDGLAAALSIHCAQAAQAAEAVKS